MEKPESLAVVHQQLDRGPPPTAKHKDRPREGVRLEHGAAQLCKAVDTAPEVGRLHRHEHAHLRRDLDHRRRNASITPATSRSLPVASRTMRRPPSASESSKTGPAGDPKNLAPFSSMKSPLATSLFAPDAAI